jgi:hypothetical protein|tara:strand:- start:3362 stop:4216 length:855 start_codon:yes stop_codon:yes gene_type:complete
MGVVMGYKNRRLFKTITPDIISNPHEWSILMYLCDETLDSDQTTPGRFFKKIEDISIENRVSIKTVERSLKSLKDKEIIYQEKRSQIKGNHNVYYLNYKSSYLKTDSESKPDSLSSKPDSVTGFKTDSLSSKPDSLSSKHDSVTGFRIIKSYKEIIDENIIDDINRIDIYKNKNNFFVNPIGEIPPEIKELEFFEGIARDFESETGQVLTDKCKEDILSLYHESYALLTTVRNKQNFSVAWHTLRTVYKNAYTQFDVKSRFPYLIQSLKNKTEETKSLPQLKSF